MVFDEPAEPLDRLGARVAVLAQDLRVFVRVAGIRDGRRSDDVAEHQRHLTPLAEGGEQRLGLGVRRVERQHGGRERPQLAPVPRLARQPRIREQLPDALGEPAAARVAVHGHDAASGSSTTIRRLASGRSSTATSPT